VTSQDSESEPRVWRLVPLAAVWLVVLLAWLACLFALFLSVTFGFMAFLWASDVPLTLPSNAARSAPFYEFTFFAGPLLSAVVLGFLGGLVQARLQTDGRWWTVSSATLALFGAVCAVLVVIDGYRVATTLLLLLGSLIVMLAGQWIGVQMGTRRARTSASSGPRALH
jgi:hypothetical protein